jgi:hypothetical protein
MRRWDIGVHDRVRTIKRPSRTGHKRQNRRPRTYRRALCFSRASSNLACPAARVARIARTAPGRAVHLVTRA